MATRVPQKGHEGFQKNTHEGATFRPKDILKNTPEVAKNTKRTTQIFNEAAKKTGTTRLQKGEPPPSS